MLVLLFADLSVKAEQQKNSNQGKDKTQRVIMKGSVKIKLHQPQAGSAHTASQTGDAGRVKDRTANTSSKI